MKVRLPSCPGVYLLRHRVTRDTYVGSSVNIRERVKTHLQAMQGGRHDNRRMRALAAASGVAFALRTLARTTAEERLRIEAEWISKLRPTLNQQGAGSIRHRRASPETVLVTIGIKCDILNRLKSFCARHPLNPRLSQVIQAAVVDFLAREEPKLPPKRKPPRH